MRSITEQGALDEFLSTAELAGTDFTAEKMNNIKIIHTDQKNPYLLTAAEERMALKRHRDNNARLTVPRRPHWDASTTPEQLDALEREAFLVWRRGLAELQENQDLLMTPFERNLEVWRQLWRVIERSDLVVQIVDARNPLLFRSQDLETYVKEVDPRKENLLLINKADMMTYKQRKAWATYLEEAGISFKFFSANLAKELLELQQLDEDEESPEDGTTTAAEPPQEGTQPVEEEEEEKEDDDEGSEGESVDGDSHDDEGEGAQDPEDPNTHILTVEELEDLFLQHAPRDEGTVIPGSQSPHSSDRCHLATDHKLQIGLVGYPNVGKSSTINALIGAKKVSVSSTPGKTKHFQTIHLSDKVVLCDCPGLVFPRFATTKAELVCNGILPIDQLREFTGPTSLITQRIPKLFLEAVYGIQIRTRALEEAGTGVPTAEELLVAYARARGFTRTGQGQPDESRAARYILKDYVSGKLLYCEPPPGEVDAREFNRELYDSVHLPEKRRPALAAAMNAMSVAEDDDTPAAEIDVALPAGPKTSKLDKSFFGPGAKDAGHLNRPFNYKYSEQGSSSGKQLSGRKARTMVALEKGQDPKDVQLLSGKKHFKGGPKGRKPKGPNRLLDD